MRPRQCRCPEARSSLSLFALSDECPCETVAPEVLGLVQGYVSAADQHGNAVTGLPHSRADRAGDVVRGCNPQSLEYVFGIRPGAAGENDDELVSSEARERVSESCSGRQARVQSSRTWSPAACPRMSLMLLK